MLPPANKRDETKSQGGRSEFKRIIMIGIIRVNASAAEKKRKRSQPFETPAHVRPRVAAPDSKQYAA